MAKQREISEVSDTILMQFMKDVKKSVSLIEQSVHDLSISHGKLETKVDGHIKGSLTTGIYVVIIVTLVGIISGLLGYIWGKENKNEKVHQRTERPY